MANRSASAQAHAGSNGAVHLGVDDLRMAARRRRRDGRLPWRRGTAFVLRLCLRHPFLLGTALLFPVLIGLVMVLNFALLIPLLDTLTNGAGLASETPLGFLSPFFEGLGPAQRIRAIAGVFLATAFVTALLTYGFSRFSQFMIIQIDRDVRTRLFTEAISADQSYLSRQKTTNLFTLVHSFPGAVNKILSEYLKALQNVAMFVSVSVSLLLLDWRLTLIAAAIAVAVNLVVIQLGRLVGRFAYDIRESRLELHRQTMESLQATRFIRLFAREPTALSEFEERIRIHRRNQYRKASIDALVSPLQSLLSAAFVGLLLIAATLVLPTTEAFVAKLVLFIVIAQRFQSQGGKYAKRRTTIAGELPQLEAIMDFHDDRTKRRMRDGTKSFTGLKQGVRVDNVRFRYDADGPDVLRGVTFEVPKGATVALVGGSGAGKSSLVNLVTRLYDPQHGRILVDGVPLTELQVASWRRRVAVVSQDAFLFNTTIRENVRYARPGATDQEVRMAARLANADEFIMEMEEGYDTPTGERGVRLSGGQAQRIAIARAILADPDLLILDEATSALDAETERKVQEALERVSAGRTTIAIAHRLSTVRKADHIVVLERGRVVERGTHDELMATKGRYWQYVEIQDLHGDGASMPAAGRQPMRPLPLPSVN